jgi:heme ABC exporter ATP-binding subunit CcmA
MSHQVSAVRTTGLSKQIDGRWVLREIDLEIAGGECVALLGANGSGKTTLLRCLASLVRPTSGDVYWFGTPAGERPRQRGLVGMVSHEGGLYAHLSVLENLLFAARMQGLPEPESRARQLVEASGLSSSVDRPVGKLSQGMRQRLALSRALIHEPPILLLDEPFTGLDATSRDWLILMLRQQQAAGSAVCFATHQDDAVEQIADRKIGLRRGSIHPVALPSSVNRSAMRWRCAS